MGGAAEYQHEIKYRTSRNSFFSVLSNNCNEMSLIKYTEEFFDNNGRETPGCLYCAHIYNEEESFFKIGISSATNIIELESKRFVFIRENGYEIELIYFKSDILYDCFLIEQAMLKFFEDIKYVPSKTFGGHSECLTKNPIDVIRHEPDFIIETIYRKIDFWLDIAEYHDLICADNVVNIVSAIRIKTKQAKAVVLEFSQIISFLGHEFTFLFVGTLASAYELNKYLQNKMILILDDFKKTMKKKQELETKNHSVKMDLKNSIAKIDKIIKGNVWIFNSGEDFIDSFKAYLTRESSYQMR